MHAFVAVVLELFSLAAAVFTNHGTETIAIRASSGAPSVDWQYVCPAQNVDYFAKPLKPTCAAKPYSTEAPTAPAASTNSLAEPINTKIQSVQTVGSTTPKAVPSSSSSSSSPTSEPSTEAEPSKESQGDTDPTLDLAQFLSFEEWKRQNLAKAGQSGDTAIHQGEKKDGEAQQQPENINALEAYGEDGEIEINFGGFGSQQTKTSGHAAHSSGSSETGSQDRLEVGEQKDPKKSEITSGHLKSKDAGKTCKERSNYASFDCAATVLKTNPECKGSNSILVENKDSYMLNKCAASNKFFIVELCNDILIDTVVLANYEFFSSMFRTFRVSVSDRYPVKLDKWKELGTYEARNTREIQAFLVKNPLIWAKYLRIEFLSQYGNEYYCPVSLLRVHGTTMMEEFNHEMKVSRGEDDSEGPGEGEEETVSADPKAVIREPVQTPKDEQIRAPTPSVNKPTTSETISSKVQQAQTKLHSSVARTNNDRDEMVCQLPAAVLFGLNGSVSDIKEDPGRGCAPSLDVSASATLSEGSQHSPSNQQRQDQNTASFTPSKATTKVITLEARSPTATLSPTQQDVRPTSSRPTDSSSSSSAPLHSDVSPSSSLSSASNGFASSSLVSSEKSDTSVTPSTTASSSSATAGSSTPVPSSSLKAAPPLKPSSSSSPPPTQESFFKTVHKRLQLLESNSTLSLQYIESQSILLRDAFSKVEKRQLNKTAAFLEALNATVLGELRNFREQYDAMWMESVREMGAQRLETQREIKSLTTSLMDVKRDVYWQQRVAALQFTVLMLFLGYFVFTHTPSPSPRFPSEDNGLADRLPSQTQNLSVRFKDHRAAIAAAAVASAYETPPASPSPLASTSSPTSFSWLRRTSPKSSNQQLSPQLKRPALTREKSLPALPDSRGPPSPSPSPSPEVNPGPMIPSTGYYGRGPPLPATFKPGGNVGDNNGASSAYAESQYHGNGILLGHGDKEEAEEEELMRPQSGPI